MCGCSEKKENNQPKTENKLNIVCTIFPPFDFAREIAGDKAEIKRIIEPGIESHGYEPTLQDIAAIDNCDIIIYVGGNTDSWVEKIIKNSSKKDKKIIKFLDIIEPLALDEEHHQGQHQPSDIDEHVWTSPKNAIVLIEKISEAICEIDKENNEFYKYNTENYLKEIENLHNELEEIVEKSAKKPLIFGDRFPFRYLVKDYGISYYAALAGCTSDTEPTISSINNLVSKIEENEVEIVFYVDSSDGTVADKICSLTGTQKKLLHSCHNISADELEENYVSLMKKNIEVIKEALG